jgi:survival-of-motor-neuron-related-splicing factor 30|uniref:Tudor domain-containing protein n=2 Tax=Panagrolaimus TaxID=55784 RepID=A0A914P4P3_9BILA
MSEELGSHKIKLEQVEVALAADPNNEDLLKLKSDLEEIIAVTQELYQISGTAESSNNRTSKTEQLSNHKWKVGDRCMARTKNGQKNVAIIDGITQEKAAITFINNGTKEIVKLNELGVAAVVEEKNYVFQKKDGGISKKDWRLEKERRKVRAQKKEQRKKAIEEEQEKEKKTWKNFNQKALNKGFKGIKRIAASGSAADGSHIGAAGSSNPKQVSSRTPSGLNWTNRGNMDSLF